MGTELVQIKSSGENMLAGLGVSESDAFKPSPIALIQKSEQGTPGYFKDVKAGFEFEKLEAVPLAFYKGRVLYVPGADFGTPPLCRSSDGINPVVNDELVRQDGGAGCAKCPMSQWKKIRGVTIKPECNETMQFVFIDTLTEFVYRLNITGTGIVPTRNLKDTLFRVYMMTKAQGNPVVPHGSTVEISSTGVSGKKGTYYALQYGPPKPVKDPGARERYQEIWDSLVNKRNVKPEEDPVEEIMGGEYVDA